MSVSLVNGSALEKIMGMYPNSFIINNLVGNAVNSSQPKQPKDKTPKHKVQVHILDESRSYHFKVKNFNDVDFVRISRENPDSAAVLVTWERNKKVGKNGVLMLHTEYLKSLAESPNRKQLNSILGESISTFWGFNNVYPYPSDSTQSNVSLHVLSANEQNTFYLPFHRCKTVYSNGFKELYSLLWANQTMILDGLKQHQQENYEKVVGEEKAIETVQMRKTEKNNVLVDSDGNKWVRVANPVNPQTDEPCYVEFGFRRGKGVSSFRYTIKTSI